MLFSPCRGGDYCTQDGTHCQGCGRSHEEIAETRNLLEMLTAYVLKMGYENVEEFTTFFGDKAAKKVRKALMKQPSGINIGIPVKK